MQNYLIGMIFIIFMVMTSTGTAWQNRQIAQTSISDIQQQDRQQVLNMELGDFRQQMIAEVTAQRDRIQKLQSALTSNTVAPNDFDTIMLQNAILMLDVKTTLVNNFMNNPVLQDGNVRSLLLAILKKDMITEGDLAALQNAANMARAQMRMQQTQTSPTVPVTPAPSPINPSP